ncbi:hypothetical protein BGW80DRAFT_1304512, partial [Lactifluus volemus]
MYQGLWAARASHSTATLSQGDLVVCMGFGSCTVSIFSCPTPALGLGGPPFLSYVIL